MQNKADIEVLRAFYPLHQPATHKAVYGGRASGKSHWAASYCILQGTLRPRRILCCREIQHTLKDSSKQLIWDKIKELGLEDFDTATEQEIRGKNGTVFWFAGLTRAQFARAKHRLWFDPIGGRSFQPVVILVLGPCKDAFEVLEG